MSLFQKTFKSSLFWTNRGVRRVNTALCLEQHAYRLLGLKNDLKACHKFLCILHTMCGCVPNGTVCYLPYTPKIYCRNRNCYKVIKGRFSSFQNKFKVASLTFVIGRSIWLTWNRTIQTILPNIYERLWLDKGMCTSVKCSLQATVHPTTIWFTGIFWGSYIKVKKIPKNVVHCKTQFLTQNIPLCRLLTFVKQFLQVFSRSQNLMQSRQLDSESICCSLQLKNLFGQFDTVVMFEYSSMYI